MKRNRYPIILFLFLFVGVSLLFFLSDSRKQIPITLNIYVEGNEETIKPWFDKESRSFYFTIPSYATDENFAVVSDGNFYVGEEKLDSSWVDKHSDSIEDVYAVTNGRKGLLKEEYAIHFCRVDNVGSMYVSTSNGIRGVLKNKDTKLSTELISSNQYGEVNYSGNDFTIKGHGNSSWDMRKKKSFTLRADSRVALMGMHESFEWVLLSNSFDPGAMRNKIVLDSAREAGYPLVSQLEYVNLYIDEEYYGLYLLTQSPKGLIDSIIDDSSYSLFSVELRDRLTEESIYYDSLGGNAIELKFSNSEDNEEIDFAFDRIAQADELIMAESDLSEDILDSFVDIKRWALRYLVDEVYENVDGGKTSAYLYTCGDDEKSLIYPGPIWDYDNSIGNINEFVWTTDDPEILYLVGKTNIVGRERFWYQKLYENQIFQNEVISIYKNCFRDILIKKIEEIPNLKELIGDAIIISAKRNNEDLFLDEYVDYLENYLTKRVRFLDEIWLNSASYYCVSLIGQSTGVEVYYVKIGDALTDNPYFIERYNGETIYDVEKGAPFDGSSEISADIILTYKRSAKKALYDKFIYNKDWLLGISYLALAIITLLFLDVKRVFTKRKGGARA